MADTFGDDARVFVDSWRVDDMVKRCDSEKVTIALDTLPPEGMRPLQVRVPDGRFSNDFILDSAESTLASALSRNAKYRSHSIPGLLKRVLTDKSFLAWPSAGQDRPAREDRNRYRSVLRQFD